MPAVLVCLEADEPARCPSVVGTCSVCGVSVWIAEAGQRTLRTTPDIKVMCFTDAMAMAAQDPDRVFEAAVGAMDEVERQEGRAARQKAEAILGGLNRAQRRAQARKQQHG